MKTHVVFTSLQGLCVWSVWTQNNIIKATIPEHSYSTVSRRGCVQCFFLNLWTNGFKRRC